MAHSSKLNSGQFSLNDIHILTSGRDNTVRLWDMRKIKVFDLKNIQFFLYANAFFFIKRIQIL